MVYAEDSNGVTIASVNSEANARLIAAAPDSMKACEALVSFCESKERLNGDSVCPTEAYDLAKTAIDKAAS